MAPNSNDQYYIPGHYSGEKNLDSTEAERTYDLDNNNNSSNSNSRSISRAISSQFGEFVNRMEKIDLVDHLAKLL